MVLTDGVEGVDVAGVGREIHLHPPVPPAGTNAILICEESPGGDRDSHLRTRRGGRKTLACGTGAVAGALVAAGKFGLTSPVSVRTAGGEHLTVHFEDRVGFARHLPEGDARFVSTPGCYTRGLAIGFGGVTTPHSAFISVGSNLGDKLGAVPQGSGCARRGWRHSNHRAVAPCRTEPVDFIGQDWFVNCVIRIETDLGPLELLDRLQSVSDKPAGRPEEFGSAAVLDLDILLYEGRVMNDPRLTLPPPAYAPPAFCFKAVV